MRIAFVSTILGYPWGGADNLWTHAAEAAQQRGDQILLSVNPLVVNEPRIAALVRGGAELVVRAPATPLTSLTKRLRRKLGLWQTDDERLLTALRRDPPDLVIFSQGGTYDLILHRPLVSWLVSAGRKFRLIANWQAEELTLAPEEVAFIRPVFEAADALFFVSARNLATTRRHLAALLPRAQVLQNPLRWRPADRTPWPQSPAARLAAVARLETVKGLDLLLEAMARLPADAPAWQLELFGRGPQENALRQQADALGLTDRVLFRGHVGGLRDIWAQNEMLISPARDEGVPMTIPEAMLCGRPVLATAVGGAEEWIEPGRSGFLCTAASASALSAAIAAALAQRHHWPAMGARAAEAAAARYRPSDHLALLAS